MSEVLLVARRELYEAFRARAYWMVMGVLVLGVAAAVVLPRLLAADTEWELGVAGEQPAGFEQDVAVLAAAFEVGVDLVPTADAEAAERAVVDHGLDAALVWRAGGEVTILRRAATRDTLVGLARQAAAAATVRERVVDAGLAPDAAEEALAAPPPQEVVVDDEQPARSLVAYAVALVLYLALIIGGGAVATGVAVEKTSRIAEVLVVTLRPSQLMAGKVLGIGASTLLLLLAGAVPFTIAILTGLVDVPPAAARDVIGGIGWFVLGFAIYATGFAALGALVDRQEDVNSAVGPLTIFLLLSFIGAVAAQNAPHGLFAQVASIFPLSAPIVMPVRLAEGGGSPFEVAAAIGLGLATLLVFVRIGGAVYRRALLRGGRRLKLAEVVRG